MSKYVCTYMYPIYMYMLMSCRCPTDASRLLEDMSSTCFDVSNMLCTNQYAVWLKNFYAQSCFAQENVEN